MNRYRSVQTNRQVGLKILFGPNYRIWHYDKEKLSYVTPYLMSKQMSKYAHYFYYSKLLEESTQTQSQQSLQSQFESQLPQTAHSLILWDMFGGIGSDAINFAQYFNVIATELDSSTFSILNYNVNNHCLKNVNVLEGNCMNFLEQITPDVIYFDPPWGETYKPKLKSFDFGHVYLDYPHFANDSFPNLRRRVSCVDLVLYLFNHVTGNIIIKSPLNSITFERLFRGHIGYIEKYQYKNLKFIYLSESANLSL